MTETLIHVEMSQNMEGSWVVILRYDSSNIESDTFEELEDAIEFVTDNQARKYEGNK